MLNEPSVNALKVLAINSLPANGNAGLKMVMGILGTRVIPVPSLLLSGIGNMAGHQRFPVHFEALLRSSLQLAADTGQEVILYAGYLGDASQPGIVANLLTSFKPIIRFVVIDPVCGDNGRAYIPVNQVLAWHELLPLADLALPNLTETALLSGIPAPLSLTEPELYLTTFHNKYPSLEHIVTGITSGNTVTNRWIVGNTRTDFVHAWHPHAFSGTGDAFASLFIYFHFFKELSKAEAVERAGEAVEKLVRHSLTAKSNSLLIFPDWE